MPALTEAELGSAAGDKQKISGLSIRIVGKAPKFGALRRGRHLLGSPKAGSQEVGKNFGAFS